jgi:pSer/pThr/pTyr-binding forkhead associated (FHA) protein
MAVLQVISGAFQGRRFALNGSTVSVGREPENDVCLPFASLSRRHAVLAKVGDHYELRDLNSTNGTFANDQQISRVVLTSDTPLRFGEVAVLYLAKEIEAPAPVPRVVKVLSEPQGVVNASAVQSPTPKVVEPAATTKPSVEFRIGSVLKKREGAGESTTRANP